MKYVKYILITLAILFLLFIAMGFIRPSISYNSEIVVDKPIKEAWAVMNDENKTSQWLKGIKKIEFIEGTKGEVGGVTKYTFEENGQESVILETIKSVNPEEHIAMDFLMEGVMKMNYKVNFSSENGKTRIKSSTVNHGIGIFTKSMFAFMKGVMKEQEDTNMSNLKKVINENTTDYFPVPDVNLDNG